MSTGSAVATADRRHELVASVAGVLVLVGFLVAGLMWAKWTPYLAKTHSLLATRHWSGSAIFGAAGHPGAPPSLAGAWRFARQYFDAVWKALVVAIAVGAGIDALVPNRWLLTSMGRRTRGGQALVGGLLSMPSMMCTCCTAPVTVGMRRRGVPLAGALAYWWGNPLLNPAVLVFLALVLPWQYVATRVAIGALVVFGVSAVLARLLEKKDVPSDRSSPQNPRETGVAPAADLTQVGEATRLRDLPVRYVRSLARLLAILVPEYAVVVLALGLVSATVSNFGGQEERFGLLAVVVAAGVATLLVIPTGGEIPVILAALAAGAGTALTGVLLVALPALSLPSMVMVGRSLGWRATAAAAVAVPIAGLVSAGLLTALS